MTETRKGEWYALLLSILESWFPILSIFAIEKIGALNAYFFVILFATIVLLAVLRYKEGYKGLANRAALPDLLGTSFFITVLFALIFLGLRYTTAGNMAVILTLQLLFSYLYFNLYGRERMDRLHTLAAFLMGTGAITVLYPEPFHLNPGDILMLIAAAIAPLANRYQKRARARVGALTILTFRNLAALPFLLLCAWLFEGFPSMHAFTQALPYLLAVSLLVYVVAKIFWIESLHRISITKLSALIALIPLFTLAFASFTLNEVATTRQILGTLIIVAGAVLIVQPERTKPLQRL